MRHHISRILALGIFTFTIIISSAATDYTVTAPSGDKYKIPGGSTTTDASLGGVVGSVPGGFNVSPSGAGSYSIPIDIPAEMKPFLQTLALTYNSNLPYGIAGVGFDLAGISSISRGPSMMYPNCSVEPIFFGTNTLDKYKCIYYLDGSQMINVTGSNGYGYYKLVNNPNILIELDEDLSGKVSNFVCYTPNGMQIHYGDAANAINSNSSGKNVRWYITKVVDYDGKYLKYTYSKNSNVILADKIGLYDKDDVLLQEIDLDYVSRDIPYYITIGGSKSKVTQKLSNITVKSNGTTIRDYDLVYNATSGIESNYLKQVKLKGREISGVTEMINPTTFTWNKYDIATISHYDSDMSLYDVRSNNYFLGRNTVVGDINNDGIDEKIDIHGSTSSSTIRVFEYAELSFDGDGQLGTGFKITNTINPSNKYTNGVVSDFDGDGKNEVLFFESASSSRAVYYKGEYLYSSTDAATGNFALYEWDETNSTLVQDGSDLTFYNINETTLDFAFGDFDGDKMTDILFYNSSMDFWVYSNSGTNNIFTKTASKSGISLTGTPFIGDFDGDGKSDIFISNSNSSGTDIVCSVSGNSISELSSFNSNIIGNLSIPVLGDFNGDGITDIADCQETSISIRVYE